MLRRLVHWLQPTFLLLAIVAIGWFLASQWPTLRTYPWRLHWGWLLATCAFSLASWAVEIAIWRHLLATLGGKLPYLVAARLWFLSAVVRYVPGNVWQPLSLTLYSRRHGVSPEATITSLVLFQVVMLLAIAPILVVYFVWLDTKSLAAQFVANFPPALLWLALIPVLAFLLRPQWLVQLLNWGLARMKRTPLALQLTSGKLFLLIAVSLFDWLLWGAMFASFTFAVIGDELASGRSGEFTLAPLQIAPLLVASYPIATLIGFLALITPSGFGVREGAFYLLLTPHIAGSVVTVIALGARVWGVVSELLAALISAPFERASLARLDHASETNEGLPLELPPYYEPGPEPLPEPFVAPDITRDLARAGRRKSV
jgi:uncharacterized membrane protein YbhN (UPF0104 family)